MKTILKLEIHIDENKVRGSCCDGLCVSLHSNVVLWLRIDRFREDFLCARKMLRRRLCYFLSAILNPLWLRQSRAVFSAVS